MHNAERGASGGNPSLLTSDTPAVCYLQFAPVKLIGSRLRLSSRGIWHRCQMQLKIIATLRVFALEKEGKK